MSLQSDLEREAGRKRRQAINACHLCDELGWRLGTDGLPADHPRRCGHGVDGYADWNDK